MKYRDLDLRLSNLMSSCFVQHRSWQLGCVMFEVGASLCQLVSVAMRKYPLVAN